MNENYVIKHCLQVKGMITTLLMLLSASTISASTPTVQASNLSVANKTCGSITVSFTRGNGTRSFITCRRAMYSEVIPTDGESYTTSEYFGSGAYLHPGTFAIAYTKNNTITISGLQTKEKYTIEIYEWDSAGSTYLTSADATITDSTHFLEVRPMALRINGDSCAKSATTLFKARVNASFPLTDYEWTCGALKDSTKVDSLIWGISKAGVYSYYVKVRPSMGCTSLFSGGAFVLIPTPKVKPILDPPGPCLPENKLQCDDQTTMPYVPKCAFIRTWDFGSNDIATFPTPDRYWDKPTYIRIVYTAETLYDNRRTGCTDSVIFDKIGAPAFKFPQYPCLKTGDSLKVSAPFTMSKYTWNNGDTTPFIWVKSSGTVTLKVKDTLGCEFTNSVTIQDCAPSSIQALAGKNSSLIITTNASEISFKNISSNNISVSVYSSDGRKLMTESVDGNQEKRTAIKPGTYIIGNSEHGYQWYLVP